MEGSHWVAGAQLWDRGWKVEEHKMEDGGWRMEGGGWRGRTLDVGGQDAPVCPALMCTPAVTRALTEGPFTHNREPGWHGASLNGM